MSRKYRDLGEKTRALHGNVVLLVDDHRLLCVLVKLRYALRVLRILDAGEGFFKLLKALHSVSVKIRRQTLCHGTEKFNTVRYYVYLIRESHIFRNVVLGTYEYHPRSSLCRLHELYAHYGVCLHMISRNEYHLRSEELINAV